MTNALPAPSAMRSAPGDVTRDRPTAAGLVTGLTHLLVNNVLVTVGAIPSWWRHRVHAEGPPPDGLRY